MPDSKVGRSLMLPTTSTIMHQQHDYAHLPGGKIHYDQPESNENLRLAGGKRFIFTLLDADRVLVDGKVKPYPRTWTKIGAGI